MNNELLRITQNNGLQPVRIATPNDLPFIVGLQKQWSNAVGFLPTCTHKRYIDANRVLIIEENDTPAGFVNWTCSRNGLIRLPQVAIHRDLLNNGLGSLLVKHLAHYARSHNATTLRLTSREKLDCNHVWPTIGFQTTAIYTPMTARRLPLIEWTLHLNTQILRQTSQRYSLPPN